MKIRQKIKNIVILLILTLLPLLAYADFPQPSAPDNITNGSAQYPAVEPGYMLNMSGGTITTLNLNATTQTPRWKGLVGNVSGRLGLQDGGGNALFNWELATVTGEIYATRNSTMPNWDNMVCATDGLIAEEELKLNITSTNSDSISNTFSGKNHDGFYAGLSKIETNDCYAIALNVNNTEQSTNFQEVLLSDGVQLVYASLLENATYGFNNQLYDFQIILAESGLEGAQPSNAYYFYIELI